jgi:membrane-associated protease RseP (regulator of RpoE activity)
MMLMDDFSVRSNASPVLTEIPRFEHPAEPAHLYQRPRWPIRVRPLNVVLFLLTILTTTIAGAQLAGAPLILRSPESLFNLVSGLSFSVPLILILSSHEMGHYLTARRYGVDSSLPYFIPGPPMAALFLIGTFGAFIRMRTPPRTRREMFDIGAAGPWAGFIIAIIATAIGLTRSPVTPLNSGEGGVVLGNSAVFWLVSRIVLGVDPNTVEVNLHPIALAGWIGLLVTAINLLPVGQLDGGHVVYSLLGGRWHRIVSRAAWAGCGLMVLVPYALHFNFWSGWLLWFVLLIVLGLGHPATTDTDMPLMGSRRVAAWATVVLFAITFSPVPLSLQTPKAPPPGEEEGQTYSVSVRLFDPQDPGTCHSASRWQSGIAGRCGVTRTVCDRAGVPRDDTMPIAALAACEGS